MSNEMYIARRYFLNEKKSACSIVVSGSKEYQVWIHEAGTVSCNCQAGQHGHKDCKHIHLVLQAEIKRACQHGKDAFSKSLLFSIADIKPVAKPAKKTAKRKSATANSSDLGQRGALNGAQHAANLLAQLPSRQKQVA